MGTDIVQPPVSSQPESQFQTDEVDQVQPSIAATVKRKSPILAIITFGLFLLILGLAGYFGYENYQLKRQGTVTPPPPAPPIKPTVTPIPSTDWKTYNNPIHNITFKYPPLWTISENAGSLEGERVFNSQVILSRNEATITMYFNMDGLGGIPQTYEGESYILDGHNLYRFRKVNDYNNTKEVGISDSLTTLGVFEIDNITHSIKLTYPKNYESALEAGLLTEFNQILATFKFSEAEDNISPSTVPSAQVIPYRPQTEWTTYSDQIANFTVQYPQNYKLGGSDPGVSVYFTSCSNDPQRGEICLSGFRITVYDDYTGGSRRAWFETKNPNFLISPYYEDVIVNGLNTPIIMDGNIGGSTGSFALIPKGNMIYLFGFPFGWNPETKEKPGIDTIKQILATFKISD
ncbi:hypothetical protein A2154_02615 [Candidatus Gottesmanbacteria bacterium RBG_16_43_7]|uniref:Uncharacterized protein n=1 Tax=Candidatus Gottesmanbacteria bacterium RBG_16_43_7 TaxID=1798373 RepID=A0A1F5ZCT4_9BACT|nr:MAG: hypothetical protein A2154_02615 [Candidatus Gottesmanbacteria bacterium RBG_16_43_7]